MEYAKYLRKYQDSLNGKTYIITGANAGIGYQCSRYLLYLGASIIMACRNLKKAEEAKNNLLKDFPNSSIQIEEYDQASFDSIYRFAIRMNKIKKIDGLICNAGVYFPKKEMKTKDGFELTIGTNYIGLNYLLESLNEKLKSDKTRVVIVTSLTAILGKKVSLDIAQTYSRNKVYATSKLFDAEEAYERITRDDYPVILAHPGVTSTNILSSKDTGLSSTFALLGRKFLNIFTHSVKKASLSIILGLLCDYKPYLYIKPRGLFAISGYPVIRKFPRKFVSKNRIESTKNITQKVGLNVVN